MHAPLTSAQKTLLDHKLRSRRDAIERELAQHQLGASRFEHAREVLLQDGDDAPQRSSDRELDLARTDHLLAELAEIDRALERIERDVYGVCVDCEAQIPFARLSLEPATPRCVTCQGRRERGTSHASL
jgi:DnaK suppressor protein